MLEDATVAIMAVRELHNRTQAAWPTCLAQQGGTVYCEFVKDNSAVEMVTSSLEMICKLPHHIFTENCALLQHAHGRLRQAAETPCTTL